MEKSPPASVYNITVDEAHCYFAEGVLVSNCDAAQYCALGMGEGKRVIENPRMGTKIDYSRSNVVVV